MPKFNEGDRVRIDIPDTSDPDFDIHGEHGCIIQIMTDDVNTITGDEIDSVLYRIELDTGGYRDLRERDVRPAIDD